MHPLQLNLWRVFFLYVIEWIYHQVESFYEPSHRRKHFYKYLCSVKKVKDEKYLERTDE